MSEVLVLDIDDVLYETAPESIKWFNRHYGNSLTLGDIFQPPTLERYGTNDFRVVMARVTEFTLALGDKLPMIEGSAEGVRRLGENFELHLATGRSGETRGVTERAVERDFPGVFQSIQFTNSLNPEAKRTKVDVCHELGARGIVDDLRIKGLNSAATRQLLFGEYPWTSRDLTPDGSVVSCRDWSAVVREAKRLAGN